jgi:cell division protease FtsH
MDEGEVAEFARTFRAFLVSMQEAAATGASSPLRAVLDDHLGRDSRGLPIVRDSYPSFEHVNVQAAVDALLSEPGTTHQLNGLLGDHHYHMSFGDLIQNSHHHGVALGAVDYVSLADGYASVRPCVQAGLYLVRPQGGPVAVLLRGPSENRGQAEVLVEVMAAERADAERVLAALRRLSLEKSVFRNQVVTFGGGQFGERSAGPIGFMGRPNVVRDDVVLPAGTFAAIEEHVFGIAEQRVRLLESGQHIKRGLLLHGPPGTGKTLTTRYLIGQLLDHTVVVLTGPALHYVASAATLARALQPAVVVLEDVDLVANERDPYGHSAPALFELLNVMDGLDEDADLTFLLTTNRADVLEPALAARPGRVDLAVEIGLPDAAGRERLLSLYGAGVDLQLADLPTVVTRTDGVTASFIKELVRKAALTAALETEGTGRLSVTDAHVTAALDALLAENATLTRALLGLRADGSQADDDSERRPRAAWLMAPPEDESMAGGFDPEY